MDKEIELDGVGSVEIDWDSEKKRYVICIKDYYHTHTFTTEYEPSIHNHVGYPEE